MVHPSIVLSRAHSHQYEKVIALNLPERSDRYDKLSLVTTFPDIETKWRDAIKGEDVGRKAWPSVRDAPSSLEPKNRRSG